MYQFTFKKKKINKSNEYSPFSRLFSAVVSVALAQKTVGPALHRILTEAPGHREQEGWPVRSPAGLEINLLKTKKVYAQ